MKNTILNYIVLGLLMQLCFNSVFAQTDLEFLDQANAEQDNQKAIEIFDKGIQKFPNSAELYYERGNRKTNIIDFFKPVDNIGMMKDFDKAIQLTPTKSWYYLGRANAYNNLKNYQAAVKDCDKALELALKAPKDASYDHNISTAYWYRAIAKQFLKDYKGAIPDLEMHIKYSPDSKANTSATIGRLYEETKDYPNALKNYTQSIEAYMMQGDETGKSGAASVLWSRGILQINLMKNQAEGCADLKIALELRPDDEIVKNDLKKLCK